MRVHRYRKCVRAHCWTACIVTFSSDRIPPERQAIAGLLPYQEASNATRSGLRSISARALASVEVRTLLDVEQPSNETCSTTTRTHGIMRPYPCNECGDRFICQGGYRSSILSWIFVLLSSFDIEANSSLTLTPGSAGTFGDSAWMSWDYWDVFRNIVRTPKQQRV